MVLPFQIKSKWYGARQQEQLKMQVSLVLDREAKYSMEKEPDCAVWNNQLCCFCLSWSPLPSPPSLPPSPYIDIVFSTTHKSKGLEWETVQIANDYLDYATRGHIDRSRQLMIALTYMYDAVI